VADKEADKDPESHPGTEPFVPDFDTGEDSVPFVPNWDDTDSHEFAPPGKPGKPEEPGTPTPEEEPAAPAPGAGQDSATESAAVPVTVPGRYQYLNWWKLALVLLGVWIAAAQVGLSLFYWWYHTIDKTGPVYMVLVYVVACTVAGVMLAMVQGRPLISALALAVMSGPFASVVAVAPLYGYYYCTRTGHCLIGVVPY
jgi:hypothetical protein